MKPEPELATWLRQYADGLPRAGLRSLPAIGHRAKLHAVADALQAAERERDIGVARCNLLDASNERMRAELAEAQERITESEAYAKEGWDWLQDALDALGYKTVFDIKDKAGERAEARDRERRLREALRRHANQLDEALESGSDDRLLYAAHDVLEDCWKAIAGARSLPDAIDLLEEAPRPTSIKPGRLIDSRPADAGSQEGGE